MRLGSHQAAVAASTSFRLLGQTHSANVLLRRNLFAVSGEPSAHFTLHPDGVVARPAQPDLGGSLTRPTLDQTAGSLARRSRTAKAGPNPALSFIWGMRDSAFGPDILARWTEAFPAAPVTRLEDAGHWPHEEQPGAVIDAIRAILAPST